MHACPRMRIPEAPTNQKKVPMGDDSQRRGMPITNSPVYKCFWVTVCSPNCVASGAGGKKGVNRRFREYRAQRTKFVDCRKAEDEEEE